MKRLLMLIFALALLFISCKTNEDENYFESSSLPGMIYDGDNRPCKKVVVRAFSLGDAENMIFTVESDINGRFTLPDLNRGTYRIELEKVGYEPMATEINYSSRLEVLYLKLYSQNQILKMAEDSLEVRRFGNVDDFLNRSEKIDNQNPYHLYLEAVYFYEMEDFHSSIESLEKIITQGYDFPYVYLLKGDIYQYQLNEPDNALEALIVFNSKIDDEEVKKRIKELQ